jgi:hypothetical protein
MHLYTASSAPSRTGRPTITLPRRAGRPVLTVPRRGPISATCRCGQERAPHEHLRPGRDCARCGALVVR